MAPRSVDHVVETIGVKAGVTNPNPRLRHLNPHLFRHSIARYLKSKGFSAEWIQNFLGHDRRFAHFPSNLLKSLDRDFVKSVMTPLQPIDYKGLTEMTEPWVLSLYNMPFCT
jgi:site-specific recombinase XerC